MIKNKKIILITTLTFVVLIVCGYFYYLSQQKVSIVYTASLDPMIGNNNLDNYGSKDLNTNYIIKNNTFKDIVVMVTIEIKSDGRLINKGHQLNIGMVKKNKTKEQKDTIKIPPIPYEEMNYKSSYMKQKYAQNPNYLDSYIDLDNITYNFFVKDLKGKDIKLEIENLK